MTRVYFVRHAQPDYGWEDDRTRPLTVQGAADTREVLDFFKDKAIDVFYCSPYQRSMDTIAAAAAFFGKTIIVDERLRERASGQGANSHEMIRKRWQNKAFCEPGGESIEMVQARNVEALKEILTKEKDKNVVIGTHGTALSSIMNYYDQEFDADAFFRIIDWMPYIIELDFEETRLSGKKEHLYRYKEFGPFLRIDLNNYPADAKVGERTAARGVIRLGDRYLMVRSRYGEYKFPGGGVKAGETKVQALLREVREETGFTVKKDTVLSIGYVEEIRKGKDGDVLNMKSYYYQCRVDEEQVPLKLDEYEKEYGYQPEFVLLAEAIKCNESITEKSEIPWVYRDTAVMKKLIGF